MLKQSPITRSRFAAPALLVLPLLFGLALLIGAGQPAPALGATRALSSSTLRNANEQTTSSSSVVTYASDSFSRLVTGGWGTANIGGSYTLSGSAPDFSVDGASGIIRSAAGTAHSAYLAGVSARDVDARFRVKTDKVAVGGGQIAYVITRRTSTGSAYLERVRFPTDGTVRLQAVLELNGADTLLGSETVVSGLTQIAGSYIWLHAQVTGSNPTTIRIRAWADGQAEPTYWQNTVTDSNASVQVAGAVGVRTYLSSAASNAPVSMSFDDLLVSSLSSPVPAFDHVFVVLEENRSYNEIIGNPSAPYLNHLANNNGLAGNYYAIQHPSLPNYLALTGGSTFGITTDCTPATCPINARNLADNLEAAGRSWKAYLESMPAPCTTYDTGEYAVRHNPFVYYNDIRTNSARCTSHVVPYTALATNLATTATTPAFVWITPNLCNDMHDCSIKTGDTWLQNNLGTIFNSPAWTNQKSVLFITWDEDDSTASNHVATLVVSPSAKSGYQSGALYNHYGLLGTVESAWGLPSLTTNDANASVLSDFWR